MEIDFDKYDGEPTEDLSAHWQAIGRLVTTFCSIEVFLTTHLRDAIGTDGRVARAIVGEARCGDLMSMITRVEAAKGENGDDYLKIRDQIFSEIRILKDARDAIAHRLWAHKGDEMLFHTLLTARVLRETKAVAYSVKELNEFADYATRLAARVSLLSGPSLPGIGNALMNPRRQKVAQALTDQALLKIPARLDPKGKPQKPPRRPKQPRQRRASGK
jgi:hypothetical protein